MAVTYWLSVATAYLTCFCVCLAIFFSLVYTFTAIPSEPGDMHRLWDLRYSQDISMKVVPIDLVHDPISSS